MARQRQVILGLGRALRDGDLAEHLPELRDSRVFVCGVGHVPVATLLDVIEHLDAMTAAADTSSIRTTRPPA